MLWVLAVVLLVLWLVGFLVIHITAAFIHLLLLAAVVVGILSLVGRTRRTA